MKTSKKVLRWEELSSAQIRKLDRQLPIIIPVGCIEAHGHLPVGCDNIAASDLAKDACAKTNTVLAPIISYGVVAPGEKDGDVPVKLEAFTAYAAAVVQGFYDNDFKKQILVNGHGGNIDALEAICGAMYEKYNGDVKIGVYNWWLDNIPKKWIRIIQDGNHADRAETDFMLARRPRLVKMSQARDSVEHNMPWCYKPGTVVDGHPTKASIAEGKKVYELVLNNLIGLIETAKANE